MCRCTSQSEAASFESDEEDVRIRLLQCKAALARLYEQEEQMLQTPFRANEYQPNVVHGNGNMRTDVPRADGVQYPPTFGRDAAVRDREATDDERIRSYDVQRQPVPVHDDVRKQGVDRT